MQEPVKQSTSIQPNRYVPAAIVLERVGLSAGTVNKLEKQNRFPKRRKLSARAVRWWLPEVEAWLINPEGWQASQANRVA